MDDMVFRIFVLSWGFSSSFWSFCSSEPGGERANERRMVDRRARQRKGREVERSCGAWGCI
jgi:hypothetical protein